MAGQQQPPIDPNTGLPVFPPQYDPQTGQYFDPVSGQPLPNQLAQQPVQQGGFAGGSPETGPVRIESSPNAAPERSIEYGNEAIRRIEQQPQPERAAEQQEQRPQPPQQPQAPKPQPKPAQPKGPEPPSFYGYKIPLQIATNPKLIAEQKEKGGDTGEARTWVYMFLDRLLKKQSQRSS
ncbi:MAG: hypothetical protein TR69_WS6001000785 [candidate division WS6 bacterium OLB20]|uniref:Uncharacterized protein n=1 Tax=candidate division WS6 bacterium OLB20 TaxID=1617426 RepID=A0A136LYL9_9BACT|nr:MAG: hypothetical protein TR69_WS6001000785 [candidate division WS6 bacterium OLB20]